MCGKSYFLISFLVQFRSFLATKDQRLQRIFKAVNEINFLHAGCACVYIYVP